MILDHCGTETSTQIPPSTASFKRRIICVNSGANFLVISGRYLTTLSAVLLLAFYQTLTARTSPTTLCKLTIQESSGCAPSFDITTKRLRLLLRGEMIPTIWRIPTYTHTPSYSWSMTRLLMRLRLPLDDDHFFS
jgi:hypothetical protein